MIQPIKAFAEIETRQWQADFTPPDLMPGEAVVFCQWLPPEAWLNQHAARVTWLPMWDNQRLWRQRDWNALPKTLRVVAFSEAAAVRARRAGLRTLRLQFFQDPALFPAATFERRTLLYWNRTGLLTEAFLRELCAVLRVDHLIFRDQIDPLLPQSAYFNLPDHIGSTTVEPLPVTHDRETYWAALKQTNIFIAPRAFEGAGSAFIEALASGCVVFAHDAPTMNEYITHGVDGALFKYSIPSYSKRLLGKVRRRIRRVVAPGGVIAPDALDRLSMRQDWDGLARLNLSVMGASARTRHAHGFARWRGAQDEYAQFVLER
ncbi:MAG: glycosyltransferase [Chloroflexota bacterium]|nr:glycosyltransferase [Chloroflexota bacterium]